MGLLDGLRGRQAKASAGSVGVPFHFAVVDLETTGLNPARDRILEVAVVLSDSHGQVLHEWCTLVNPGTEFGAGHIHGIDVSWLAAAPSFAELAAEIGTRLNGRVLVGHNAELRCRLPRSRVRSSRVPVRAELPSAGHDGHRHRRRAPQRTPLRV